MTLFGGTKTGYLGIDVGTASIKLVELKSEGGKPRLVTYGYIDIATDIIRSNTPQAQQKIVQSLTKLVESSGATSANAIAALPTFSVFNSIITLPKMPTKDLASAVKWEAKKYIPLPMEEMILDWKIITGEALDDDNKKEVKKKGFSFFKKKKAEVEKKVEKKADKEKHIKNDGPETFKGKAPKSLRILVTAAPKNLVNRYIDIFKKSGLRLISLETEAFALARSLIGIDDASIAIVDIGSITTDICIIEKGVPVLNRSIDVGGYTITQAISRSLNVTPERAEQFKMDIGISLGANVQSKGIPKVITDSLSPIVNEIKYVFDLYQNQGNLSVEKIILSGGSAFLPNLSAYFTEIFNKPTIIGNPWDRVVYPEELKPVLDEVGTRLAVAIGLAMRDV